VIFCDTSAFYALLAPDDEKNTPATRIWRELIADPEPRLCTTNYVIVESIALLQKRFGLRPVAAFRKVVEPFVRTVYLDGGVHAAAFEELLAIDRRKLSLVDCSSFAFMRRHHIREAFAFDAHFEEFGFELIS
jgi:predicted nucleic acid-binding protein